MAKTASKLAKNATCFDVGIILYAFTTVSRRAF